MQTTTEAVLDDAEDKDDDVIRSLRFKKVQWEAIKKHIAKHGIKMAPFLRNAALRAAGYQTEGEALARAVDSVVAPPPKKTSTKKRR